MIDGSSHAALKRLLELFPPEANTDSAFYVLLDCTEDKSALAELHSLFFELEACGLFDKSCGQDMADKGPLLVRIPFDGRAREWMARDDVLRGTAMFLFSPLDFPKLCLHLKALLKCGTEYGQRLLFRFYDDNILYAALEGGFRPAFHMLAAFDAVALNIVDARNIRKWVLIRNEMPPEALPARMTITHEDLEFFQTAAMRYKMRDYIAGNFESLLHIGKRSPRAYSCDRFTVMELVCDAARAISDTLYEETCERLVRLETEFGINDFGMLLKVDKLLFDASLDELEECRAIVEAGGGDASSRLRDILAARERI